ncbi:MAG: DNA repair protein RecN [Clostridiales bacterium]|nr:DNA repair protein RecN [Clostridiales bacterium]
MLRELYIENLATIEKATIKPGEKLNVLTGETGAGKSILIGSINAILGHRVSKDIIRAGEKKAVISAVFDEIPEKARQALENNGYDIEDGLLILQREISSDGKSVARIGTKPATISVLREIGSELIDIHGQNDNRILMNNDNQRELLDSYGNLGEVLSTYRENFRNFSKLSKQIRKLQLSEAEKADKIEMLKYQIEELELLNLKPDEDENLSLQLDTLHNSAKIQENLYKASVLLDGDGEEYAGSISEIDKAKASLEEISELLPDVEELSNRLDSVIIELDDICSDLKGRISDIDDNAGRLIQMEDRMSDIIKIKRKYGMDVNSLIEHLEQCKEELSNIDEMDSVIEDLINRRREIGEGVKEKAMQITQMRKSAGEKLSKDISEQLRFLNMADVVLEFDIKQDKVTVNGMDNVEIMISVNRGEELKPLNKVASGGELSRIMLAVKSVLADKDSIPTMIFDEIDTGISGRAAQKVGIKLSQAAQNRQVLCVTHLAQIAAKGDSHFLIEKEVDKDRTFTQVRQLDFDQRKAEIARIIGGDVTEISLKNAEELLNS